MPDPHENDKRTIKISVLKPHRSGRRRYLAEYPWTLYSEEGSTRAEALGRLLLEAHGIVAGYLDIRIEER